MTASVMVKFAQKVRFVPNSGRLVSTKYVIRGIRWYTGFPYCIDMEKLERSAKPRQEPSGFVSKKTFGTVEGHSDGTPRTSATQIKLSIGDTLIVAEKEALIGNSPYFASLLRFHKDNMDAFSMVPPDNVRLTNFLAVLYTLSNPSVKLAITPSNLSDFYILSKYFQLDQVEEECGCFAQTAAHVGMDELCRLWRSGHANGFDKVTTLVLAGISLRLESAIQSRQFLDLTAAELVALMSDDGFLPLTEVDVCKAVIAWFEHDPLKRKKLQVLDSILAQVVWNPSTNGLLLPFAHLRRGKPGKLPKRTAKTEGREDPSPQQLKKAGCNSGIIIGDYFYGVEGLVKFRKFHRVNLTNGKRSSWDEIKPYWETDQDKPAGYRFCHVKLAGRDYIGFLLSSWMDMQYECFGRGFTELVNSIALYDTTKAEWTFLPNLPLPRIDPALIQCGTFLYMVGGTEYKLYESGSGNAHHCYRLDLSHFPNSSDEDFEGEWERIADLNFPRVGHDVKIEHGRVVVYGGKTETGVDEEGDKAFEEARWSEAYDTAFDTWTLFSSS